MESSYPYNHYHYHADKQQMFAEICGYLGEIWGNALAIKNSQGNTNLI